MLPGDVLRLFRLVVCWGIGSMLAIGLWPLAHADDALIRWRSDAAVVRRLADNNAPEALAEAQRLHKRLPTTATPEDRARNLNLQARVESYMGDTASSIRHADQAIALARSHALKEAEAEAWLTNVLNFINTAEMSRSVDATEKALALLQGSNNVGLLSEAMLRAVASSLRKEQMDEAIALSLQLLELAQHNQQPLALTHAYQAVAAVYSQSNREAEAIEHYARMTELAKLAGSGMLEAHGMSAQASLLKHRDMATAEQLTRAAVARFRTIGMPLYLAHSLYGLADILRAQKEHARSLETLNEVAAIYQRHPNRLGQWRLLLAFSQDHQALGQLAQAQANAQHAMAIADELGLPLYFTQSARRLSEVEAALGHHQAAYDLMVQAQSHAQHLEKERISNRLGELSKRFQQDSRQREIERLAQESEVQSIGHRWLVTLLGAATLLLALTGYHLIKVQRINRQTKTLNHELQQSRNRMQAMLDALPDLVFEVNMEGRYLSCHTREHALLISPAAELIGRTVTEMLPPHVCEVVMKALHQAQEEGTSSGWQYPLHLPKGLCWFDLFIAKMDPLEGSDEERFMVMVRDISVGKQAEIDLKESEHRYRQVFESVSDTLYLMEITPDGDIKNLEFNPAFEALTGKSRRDLIGRDMKDTFSPEGVRVTEAKIRRCLETGQRHDENITLELAGVTRHLHATVIPVRDATGRIHRVVGIGRDITDQERAKQLMLSQLELDRRLAHFAELAPGAMFSYQQSSEQAQGFFHYASQGMEDVCGVTSAQLLADPHAFLKHIAPEVLDSLWNSFFQAAQARETCHIEYQIQHPTQGERWLELRATPETSDAGVVLWHGHVMDITARKLVESRLHASEQAFRTLAENFPDPIARFDLHGRLIYTNPKILKLMAQSGVEVRLKRPSELAMLCDTTPTSLVEANARKVIESGEPVEHLAQWLTPFGLRIFEIRHIPEKDNAGQLVSVMSVGRNITRQKQAEQELKQSRDELRRLSAHLNHVREEERKRIAREIHDELGQMLTALKLDLGTLRLQFGAINPVLDQRSQRLVTVVEDTIQVVRSIATALRPSSLDMGLVPAVEWLVAEFRKRSDVECVLHIQNMATPLEDEQSTALFRMLQEALTNVTRHAQAHRVDIVLDSDEDHLLLRVTDDGVGFDPDGRKTHSFGLVGIHERALILGGSAKISSRPGTGTSVEVSIPRHLNERQFS
ncbi:MAG TPA: PAS domain-containing protein [Burkholderiaceae bacterium]|nr:PAS domain-containing protein [Burkholderiaceae bacterium]